MAEVPSPHGHIGDGGGESGQNSGSETKGGGAFGRHYIDRYGE
jgi:hypothetical protein